MSFPTETFVTFVSNAPLANPPGPSDFFPFVQGSLLKKLPANSVPLLVTVPTQVINQSTYNATINDQAIFVNRAPAAATTINLPANPGLGRQMLIKDIAGNAGGGHTITIAGGTIDGAAGATITTNYGYIRIQSTGIGNNWAVVT